MNGSSRPAQSYSNTMGDANIPLYLRYFTASLAQHDWLNVALQCPSQFGDATIRSAQAQHFTRLAANHFGFAYGAAHSDEARHRRFA